MDITAFLSRLDTVIVSTKINQHPLIGVFPDGVLLDIFNAAGMIGDYMMFDTGDEPSYETHLADVILMSLQQGGLVSTHDISQLTEVGVFIAKEFYNYMNDKHPNEIIEPMLLHQGKLLYQGYRKI